MAFLEACKGPHQALERARLHQHFVRQVDFATARPPQVDGGLGIVTVLQPVQVADGGAAFVGHERLFRN